MWPLQMFLEVCVAKPTILFYAFKPTKISCFQKEERCSLHSNQDTFLILQKEPIIYISIAGDSVFCIMHENL